MAITQNYEHDFINDPFGHYLKDGERYPEKFTLQRLDEMIIFHTHQDNKMPVAVYGKYEHFLGMDATSKYMLIDKKPYFQTVLGLIEIRLDANAKQPYVSD